jgi:hypothetical protein
MLMCEECLHIYKYDCGCLDFCCHLASRNVPSGCMMLRIVLFEVFLTWITALMRSALDLL